MLVDEVAKMPVLDRLLYWIRERNQIYLRRRAGKPKPWTDDVILQSVSFCNPYRENDRTTIWLRENIRDPLVDDPRVAFAVLAFRWFNLPTTGQLLTGLTRGPEEPPRNYLLEWDCAAVVEKLTRLRGYGNQIFTGAFNISNGGSTKPKINRVCEDYLEPAWQQLGPDGPMLEDILRGVYERKITLTGVHELLGTLPGMGGSGFMAAQVVADLKYTYFLPPGTSDWWTWCSPGPGSKRGMNRLRGLHEETPLKPVEFKAGVIELMTIVNTRFVRTMEPFHAQDVQNCCCEFSKYETALEGGHSKRRYNGAT